MLESWLSVHPLMLTYWQICMHPFLVSYHSLPFLATLHLLPFVHTLSLSLRPSMIALCLLTLNHQQVCIHCVLYLYTVALELIYSHSLFVYCFAAAHHSS
jgi:hypothetical protein